MRVIVATVFALAGCRGVFGIDDPILRDARAATIDAVDAPLLLGPWGPARLVLPSMAADDDPTLTDDMLEMYFNRSDDIYRTTRASLGADWGPPVLDSQLSSFSTETTPEISGDGLFIVFASNRAGGPGGQDLWMSTRPERAAAWSTPTVISSVSSASTEAAGGITGDEKEMFFTSDLQGSADLYMSTRAGFTWGTPLDLSILNTTSMDANPCPSKDGLTLYFDSNRNNSQDLYVTTRPSRTQPFVAPTKIVELSGTAGEADPWVSADQRHLFFSSDLTGKQQIYEATR